MLGRVPFVPLARSFVNRHVEAVLTSCARVEGESSCLCAVLAWHRATASHLPQQQRVVLRSLPVRNLCSTSNTKRMSFSLLPHLTCNNKPCLDWLYLNTISILAPSLYIAMQLHISSHPRLSLISSSKALANNNGLLYDSGKSSAQ